MRALKYKINICDNILSHVHGQERTITELHVPDLDLFINGEAVFVSTDSGTRVPKEHDEIQVDEKMMRKLVHHVREERALLRGIYLLYLPS